jgi:hypothetical protein
LIDSNPNRPDLKERWDDAQHNYYEQCRAIKEPQVGIRSLAMEEIENFLGVLKKLLKVYFDLIQTNRSSVEFAMVLRPRNKELN